MKRVSIAEEETPPELPGTVYDDHSDGRMAVSGALRSEKVSDKGSTDGSKRSSQMSFRGNHRGSAEFALEWSQLTGVSAKRRTGKKSVFGDKGLASCGIDSKSFVGFDTKGLNMDSVLVKRMSDDSEKPFMLNVPRRWSREDIRNRLRASSLRLIDSPRFGLLTVFLTCYALLGDDFRLAGTHKRKDIFFDIFTMTCLLIFMVEIVATCFARSRYIGSFFFWLDVLPTGTLILDLTFVADLLCSSVDGDSAMKSGRAGRAGARAGRTVRIIRLIRLVKVYKMYAKVMQRREKKRQEEDVKRFSEPGEDSDEELEADGGAPTSAHGGGEGLRCESEEMQASDSTLSSKPKRHGSGQSLLDSEEEDPAETRVGRKLSEMTTRRVIILVLVMLFGLPMFRVDNHGLDNMKHSAALGMEQIYEKWRKSCPKNSTHPQELPSCLRLDSVVASGGNLSFKPVPASRSEARFWFEKYFLTFVYVHHAGPFAWALHWVGFKSTALTAALTASGDGDAKRKTGIRLGALAQLAHEPLVGNSSLHPSTWNLQFANSSWMQEVVHLPEEVRARLASPWKENCIKDYYGVRVALNTPETRHGATCTLFEDLRCSEIQYYLPIARSVREGDELTMVYVFDKRSTTTLEAWLSMLQTVFICFAVGFGAMTFTSDADKLILKPVGRMMAKLESLKNNPMEAMRLGDLEFRRCQFDQLTKRTKFKQLGCFLKMLFWAKERNRTPEPIEIIILERTIIKLGSLLSICYGETGGEIVATSIPEKANSHTPVDLMHPGEKIRAVIGMCYMRDLNTVLNCFQEDVLVFINRISEIVHSLVDEYSGSPNKNMGYSFMLAWRFPKDKHARGHSSPKDRKRVDCSIVACIKIIARIRTCPELLTYQNDETLQRLHQGFKVEVGFGLNYGWAIEGIIGSKYKIDASYIAPQIAQATSLQRATSCYGVQLLMSHHVVAKASPEVAQACRLIDQVSVSRGQPPLRIYTVDLDTSELKQAHVAELKGNRFRLRQIREEIREAKWAPAYNVWEELLDQQILTMRAKYSPEFFKRFFTAYRNYECGEWMVARDMFFTCDFEPNYETPPVNVTEEDWPIDGPTRVLLRFMQQFAFVCPDDWPGYREIPTYSYSCPYPYSRSESYS